MSLCWLTIGIAAEPGEPAPFAGDVEARPINEAESSTSNVLRWKPSSRASVSDYVASDAAAQPMEGGSSERHRGSSLPTPVRAGWNITRIDPSVRQAQYTASDPFRDPFGDKQANHKEPSLVLQPTPAEASADELPPPRTLSPVRRALPERSSLTAAQPPDAPMPSASLPGARSTAPCDRVYSDRNCCDKEAECHDFRNRLLADSIRNISLDITPSYDRDPDLSPEENEATRIEKLRLLENRSWRDRRGAVIATGKMTNLQNGAVVIADDSGREVGRLPIRDLGEDELCYITAWWHLPGECPLGGLRAMERNWLASTFHYHASALCHKPLYFEEVQLERYGHTAGPIRQPIISGAHFVLNLALLPYHMGINPPTECQYALGYYRPGSCAPWMIPPVPLSLRGAAAEVGAALGMFYIIP